MTSPFTNEATCKFFESHKYFGLETDQVTFFRQGTLPCISRDGRFIMESPYKELCMETKIGSTTQMDQPLPVLVNDSLIAINSDHHIQSSTSPCISSAGTSLDQSIHVDETRSQDQEKVPNSSKLRSSAWSHFTKVDVHGVSKAKHNYCTKVLSGCSKNETRHLHSHYKVCPRRKYGDIKQKILVNKLAKEKDESQTISAYSFYQETGKRELAAMILLHDYPLNIVDHVGFRRFLNIVQPLFKIPTRNTIKDEIKTIYKEKKKQLTNLIEKNESKIAITTDMWTASNQKRGYMVVTAHFVDQDRALQSRILRFANVPSPHTAMNLTEVAKAPDGNGGLYAALNTSRLLEDMAMRGIKYVDVYGVDNALVRVADPAFLGYFIDKGVTDAAKVVRKAYPQEKVGVFVQRGRGGPLTVIEYSEMDPSMASEINQTTGCLRFCWSNVCLHMFTLDFLHQVANVLKKDGIYHLAEKKIPSIHGYTMGLKLEQFIFDAFAYAPSTALFEVLREEEFAPVKNANGASHDTPDSARLMLLRLHSRWVVAAGGFLKNSVPLYLTGVEISPLCSYAGENLEAMCRGRTFHAPCEIAFLVE